MEKPSSSRCEIGGAESPITGNTGKWVEDERVAEGLVVATKRSNVRRAKRPCCWQELQQHGRQGRMRNTPISLQDLRRRLYVKAKTEPAWRFWGLYVHICKMETLQEGYQMAKANNGAPGIDGVTFAAIEESGVQGFLQQIREELINRTYRPMPARKKEIPKDGGHKVRVLSIPAIRDGVVQGALKFI